MLQNRELWRMGLADISMLQHELINSVTGTMTLGVLISAPAHFFFHSLGEPLLHHRLVVQESGARDPLDAGEHTRIEAQGDGGGFLGIGCMDRGVDKTGVERVDAPECVFCFVGIEIRNFVPV